MRFFYNTVTKDSICDDIDFLCGSTSASYPLQAKNRNVNQHYFNVVRLIWESQDRWQYDDSNYTDLPRAKTTMVANQRDYSLPATAQRIRRVQVKDSNGNWQKVTSIDEADITEQSIEEFQESSGLPIYYDLVGRSLFLFPAPASGSTTLSAGLEIHVDRTPSAFASASTNSPGFPEPFHRILSLAASVDFIQDPNRRQYLVREKEKLEMALKNFYAHRNIEQVNKIQPRSKRFWRRYI